jgi:gamma-glutamyltranspeptidase/glutathione hydrolase
MIVSHGILVVVSRLRTARWLIACSLLILTGGAAQAGRAAIASAHPLATAAGHEILAQGGNAFDAAIAVTATLGVVEPYASGLGGGGFFLLRRADGFQAMVDARETAPEKATPELYLDAEGHPKGRLSLEGALAAGIPGIPAGLAWLAERYGALPLSVSLAPAIRHAREGFPVDARYLTAAGFREGILSRDSAVASIFLADGRLPQPGFVLRQPALARTLEALAQGGRDAFYRGELAQRMVAAVQAAGGIWTQEDLARYRVVEREPITIQYAGARIATAALPSSGGLVLAEALHILERYPLDQLPRAERDHLVVEALRRGYQDRSRYLGDADFVAPPLRLGTRAYADTRAASIDLARATPSAELDARYPPLREGDNTTHFSLADGHGNLVAATLSINLAFGAGMMAGDTGVLLNNEMDDFTLAPGEPNTYRLTGERANTIQPGKRPLSSMTPTLLEDERGVLLLGSPGGSRIISMVLLGILEYVHAPAVNVEGLVGAPRFHHQYLPDRIEYEPGGAFPADWIESLKRKGHTLQEGRRKWGNMQSVFVERASGDATAYNDPRGRVGVVF